MKAKILNKARLLRSAQCELEKQIVFHEKNAMVKIENRIDTGTVFTSFVPKNCPKYIRVKL